MGENGMQFDMGVEEGQPFRLDLLKQCKNIRARENIKIERVLSSAQVNSGGIPNPVSKPLFIGISSECVEGIEIK